MKILLISPPYFLFTGEPKWVSPPLGLAYMAAVLEGKGHELKIIDCALDGYDNEYKIDDEAAYYGLSIEKILEIVSDYSPSVIGISIMFSTLSQISDKICNAIRNKFPDIKIVIGGAHASVLVDELLNSSSVDFIIRGEGEYALSELLEHLSGARPIDKVRNLSWQDENGKVHSTPQVFIEDLDRLPLPARHLLNIDAYIRIGKLQGFRQTQGSRATTMITSRGCPAKCVFCAIHPLWGKKFRHHSPEYVLKELKYLRDKFGITHILFEDDNLTFSRDRALHIFQGMIDENLNLKWITPNGVALWRLDQSMLELMKKSGCIHLCLAFESGVQDTLTKIIKKPLRLDKIKDIPSICKKLGIETTGFFVVGFPGETMEAIERTLDYAVKSELDDIALMIATPYPGTQLYQICDENGYLEPQYSYNNLMTRIGQIQTPDFAPDQLDYLIEKAILRFSIYHPLRSFKKLAKRFIAKPLDTPLFIVRKLNYLFKLK